MHSYSIIYLILNTIGCNKFDLYVPYCPVWRLLVQTDPEAWVYKYHVYVCFTSSIILPYILYIYIYIPAALVIFMSTKPHGPHVRISRGLAWLHHELNTRAIKNEDIPTVVDNSAVRALYTCMDAVPAAGKLIKFLSL